MDSLTLDQFAVFVTVAEQGSFSAAARRLHRAQSAVTYAVQKLEEQIGSELFDRSAYRPVLAKAGFALLPKARRILDEVDAFRVQARGLADGLEAELSLVIDSMVPMRLLVGALADLQGEFPSVQPRVQVETLGAAADALIERIAEIGLVTAFASDSPTLARTPVGEIVLVPVAAPGHPLARLGGVLEAEQLRDHVQLVLSDRSSQTAGKDHGVVASATWRIADLGARHAMLIAGLGWGSMPLHMVEADLKEGRLVRLAPRSWDGAARMPILPIVCAHRRDRPLGPAGRWLLARLVNPSSSPDPPILD